MELQWNVDRTWVFLSIEQNRKILELLIVAIREVVSNIITKKRPSTKKDLVNYVLNGVMWNNIPLIDSQKVTELFDTIFTNTKKYLLSLQVDSLLTIWTIWITDLIDLERLSDKDIISLSKVNYIDLIVSMRNDLERLSQDSWDRNDIYRLFFELCREIKRYLEKTIEMPLSNTLIQRIINGNLESSYQNQRILEEGISTDLNKLNYFYSIYFDTQRLFDNFIFSLREKLAINWINVESVSIMSWGHQILLSNVDLLEQLKIEWFLYSLKINSLFEVEGLKYRIWWDGVWMTLSKFKVDLVSNRPELTQKK